MAQFLLLLKLQIYSSDQGWKIFVSWKAGQFSHDLLCVFMYRYLNFPSNSITISFHTATFPTNPIKNIILCMVLTQHVLNGQSYSIGREYW